MSSDTKTILQKGIWVLLDTLNRYKAIMLYIYNREV